MLSVQDLFSGSSLDSHNILFGVSDTAGFRSGGEESYKGHLALCPSADWSCNPRPQLHLSLTANVTPVIHQIAMSTTEYPQVPYEEEIPNAPLKVGSRIGIVERLHNDGETFHIGLLSAQSSATTDVLLALEAQNYSPLKEMYFTASSYKDGASGKKVAAKSSRLQLGEEFQIFIELEKTRFKVTVNGDFLLNLDYAFPLETVKFINVTGDVDLYKVYFPAASA